MLPVTSPRKKLVSVGHDNVPNPKCSVTCTNVPEELFDANTAKKHFSKFGRVQKIRLFPKKLSCIVEYEQPSFAERAVLNAGAFDGFMFDVTRTKPRVRKRSIKKDDDPDWVPDPDVEEELSAMVGAPSYRMTRQKPMDIEPQTRTPKMKPVSIANVKKSLVKKKIPVHTKPPTSLQPASGRESPVLVVNTQTTMSTYEAAAELHQLRSKISTTPDEQWRTLDARDRILRSWGGAGSRVKVGGATIGTCQDMCPEKELLHRQAEHQVMTLETYVDSDGQMEAWRAVKQYSRSSADQEMPMCYELRPASTLMRTCSYLLREIADTTRQVTLADWFHFMWDRLRSIRKDITQQALCCADSINLVEMCARFHGHCAARLADLEHTQFDQKLNTDNLTKCLQTLKHMYADVTAEQKPREAEFRGYIALLNLGDANFWWEIKQLPLNIQKSGPIIFAIKVFNALDNNNYVRFFRLVQQKATYLQACILLRYFNDVRARALARIVKAFAPRGGSRYPAVDLMKALAFESIESMKSFINHYGLRFAKADDFELSIILDRNQFIEDSDPFPIARAVKLIESKRQMSVGEVIAGGVLPNIDYSNHILYTSFAKDGRLKETALIAEDQGFNTINDSNKDIKTLKAELQRLLHGGKTFNTEVEKPNVFVKPEAKTSSPKAKLFGVPLASTNEKNLFLFKPAIPVAPAEIIKNSPDKIFDDNKNIFSFSKPQETSHNLFSKTEASNDTSLFVANPESRNPFDTKTDSKNVFENQFSKPRNVFDMQSTETKKPESSNLFNKFPKSNNLFDPKPEAPRNIFATNTEQNNEAKSEIKSLFDVKVSNPFQNSQNVFQITKPNDLFKKQEPASSIFGQNTDKTDKKQVFGTKPSPFEGQSTSKNQNIFTISKDQSLFTKPDSSKFDSGGNIFAKPSQDENKPTPNIFQSFNKTSETKNIFAKQDTDGQSKPQSIFSTNGDIPTTKLSPSSLFKSALPPNGTDSKNYSIFQSKNKAQTVADNILNSVISQSDNNVYNFEQNDDIDKQMLVKEQQLKEEQLRLQEEMRKEEELKRQVQLRIEKEKQMEEARKKQQEEEARRKQEEQRIQEEKRKREEIRKQEELKKRLEEERLAEIKRKEEEVAKFKEAVAKESARLTEELINEVVLETDKELIKLEQESLRQLISYANDITEEIATEICNEICDSEMKAEIFLTKKIMKKWFYVWRSHFIRNYNRRKMLYDTPVWLPERTPMEKASELRRVVETFALKNMNAIHKGYKFKGELRQPPPPEPYNIVDIIRSPLLKRMKEICYPYDKCFFWKVTLISTGQNKWLCRKIHAEKWLHDAFSDNKSHEESDTLIHVGKQSWNHLMDFAISVSLISNETIYKSGEAIEGANGVLYYATDNYNDLVSTIKKTLKVKYPYQTVPVAVIMPTMDEVKHNAIQKFLDVYVEKNHISCYKIFVIDPQNIVQLLNVTTKSALKWLAKKYPKPPPLEIDYLKSICQRYLGNEIWCRFRIERDNRMRFVIKHIQKLVHCYNVAVDKLTDIITNFDLFNYVSFPLEFRTYLNEASPYPKPYEFIPSHVKTSENISAIRDIMKQLKLPMPSSAFNPLSAASMQQQIRGYCNQIGWFEDPEEVACKVVAVLPNELSDVTMPTEDFTQYFAQYDLIDFLNIIVYEKINILKNFDNRFAIYEKSVLQEFSNINWLYEVDVVSELKHKAIECDDDEIDYFIEAKRRKLALDSLEYLMLEDKDSKLVEKTIENNKLHIENYNNCTEAVKQLEIELEERKKQSIEFENMLKAALADV